MALAERVHALALEVYAKRPAGVAPTAWLTDSTGVPAHRVAAQLVKQAAVLEGLTAHVGLDFALGDVLARLREAVKQYEMYIEEVGEVDQTQKVRREQVEAEKKRVKAEVVVVSDDEEDAPLSKRVKTKPVSPATPAPAPAPRPAPAPAAPQLLLTGHGSKSPKIFVQKRNSCVKNRHACAKSSFRFPSQVCWRETEDLAARSADTRTRSSATLAATPRCVTPPTRAILAT